MTAELNDNQAWKYVRETLDSYGKELTAAMVILKGLEKSLFGNGQPGIITLHEERLDRLERVNDLRKGAERQKKLDIANIVKIIGIVGGALGIWGHILGLGAHIK